MTSENPTSENNHQSYEMSDFGGRIVDAVPGILLCYLIWSKLDSAK